MDNNFASHPNQLQMHTSATPGQQPTPTRSSSSNLYLASPTSSHSSPVLAPLPSHTSALSAIPFSNSASQQLRQDANLSYSQPLAPGPSVLQQQQSPQQPHFHHFRQQYQQYHQEQQQAKELQFLRQQLLDKGGQQAQHQERLIAPSLAPLLVAAMPSSTRSASRKRDAPASQPSNSTTGSVNKKRCTVATAGKVVNNKVLQPADDTKFWKKPGMKTFLSWLLNPNNQQRLKKAGTTSGVMKKDLYREIADLVNAEAIDQTHEEWQPWVERQVKYNIATSEQKYRKAKKMWTETGAGDDNESLLRKRVLKICPLFDKFDRVYSSNFRVNPPPMVQTTTIPGEPTELLDDSEEGDESGEGEGDESDEGDECDEDEEGDESDEGGEDVMGLEDHRHLQVEGFDRSLLFAGDDDETINNTHARDSTSSVHRTEPSISSSMKNQQSKKRASKGKSKDTPYPQHEAMFQKLAQLSSMNAALSGGLMGDIQTMRREVAERERGCLKRELDWVNHGLERMAELNRKLEERRQEHEQQLQQAKAAFEKERIEWTLFKNEEMAKLNRLKGTLDRQESHSQTPSVTFMNIVKSSPSPHPSASS